MILDANDLITSCLTVNEFKRISLDNILKHDWLKTTFNIANEIDEIKLIPDYCLIDINQDVEKDTIEESEVLDLILDCTNDSGVNSIEIVSEIDLNLSRSESSENDSISKFDMYSSIITIESVNNGDLILDTNNNSSLNSCCNTFEMLSKFDVSSSDSINNSGINTNEAVSMIEIKKVENKKINFWLGSVIKIKEKLIKWCQNVIKFYHKFTNFH